MFTGGTAHNAEAGVRRGWPWCSLSSYILSDDEGEIDVHAINSQLLCLFVSLIPVMVVKSFYYLLFSVQFININSIFFNVMKSSRECDNGFHLLPLTLSIFNEMLQLPYHLCDEIHLLR